MFASMFFGFARATFLISLLFAGFVFCGAQVVPEAELTRIDQRSFEQGRADAAESVRDKKLVLKIWGLPELSVDGKRTTEDIYRSILKSRYKIRLERISFCTISARESAYAEGWNEGIKTTIEARFGIGVLEKAWREASNKN